ADIPLLEAMRKSRLIERASILSGKKIVDQPDNEEGPLDTFLRKQVKGIERAVQRLSDTISYLRWSDRIAKLSWDLACSSNDVSLRPLKFRALMEGLRNVPVPLLVQLVRDEIDNRQGEQDLSRLELAKLEKVETL